MENVISYYYNLIVDKSKLINNVLITESNGRLFILKVLHNIDNFEHIILNINNSYYPPIITKEGKYYFEYNGANYVLFQADNPSGDASDNLLYIPIVSSNVIDYSTVWENNIDYFINQISKMDKEELDKITYLNYYIGMSENAITINESAKRMQGLARMSISHFRIKYPNYNLSYKDPTELVEDYISRDIAEYTKSKFFSNDMEVSELINLINRYELTDKEIMFLFARLMYPNYYYDAIAENNIEKQQIIHKKREKYELFLYNTIRQIKTANLYLNIDWLKH